MANASGVGAVGGLTAVANPSFVEYQQQLGAYRQQKLSAIEEQNAAKQKAAADKAEELGFDEVQDITKDIVPGFYPQVQQKTQEIYAKIHDIYDKPGRTNVQRDSDFHQAFQDFRNSLMPMIQSSAELRQAASLPADKLNAEQKDSILGGIPSLAQKMVDGTANWSDFTSGMTKVPNALNSYALDPANYGFKLHQQDIQNPDDLIKKGTKGNIVDLVNKYLHPAVDGQGNPLSKVDPETGLTYESMEISDEDAEKLAKTLMATDPRFHPAGGMFNGFLNAGYYDKGEDGSAMKYTVPQYDAEGKLVHISTKPVDEMNAQMEQDLVKLIKLAGQQALVKPISPYSNYAFGQKKALAYVSAGAKGSTQNYQEAPLLSAYINDITKKQDESKKQLADVEKQRKTALNNITYKDDADYAEQQEKINKEYDEKSEPLKEQFNTYTSQVDLLNKKNAYLNSKGITNQKILKELHQQINDPEQSLVDYQKVVDEATGTKSPKKEDDVDKYFRK